MQVERMVEQATEQALIQALSTMQATSIAAFKIVANTTDAICNQLTECKTIDDLANVIKTLRDVSA